MRLWLPIGLCVCAVWLTAGSVWADSGVPHVELPDDSPVPISGAPFFVEDLTVGGAFSDLASHVGVKASVRLDHEFVSGEPVGFDHALNMAHYACWAQSRLNRQWDQSYFELVGQGDYSPDDREITFSPWGWTEEAYLGVIYHEADVVFIDRDVLMWHVTLRNTSEQTLTFNPRMVFFKDADTELETMETVSRDDDRCRFVDKQETSVLLDCDDGNATLPVHFLRFLGVTGPGAPTILKASGDESVGAYVVGLSELTMAPEAKLSFAILLAYGRDVSVNDASVDPSQLRARLNASMERAGLQPNLLVGEAKSRWETQIEALPPVHTVFDQDRQLADLALAALVHGRYGETGDMLAPTAVSTKSYQNEFRLADAAFLAVGLAEFDPESAKSLLSFFFSHQLETPRDSVGFLHGRMWEDGTPLQPDSYISAPPSLGAAALAVFKADGGRDTAWLEEMYQASSAWLEFWRNQRDAEIVGNNPESAADALCEYVSPAESGWGDSVRFGCSLSDNARCEEGQAEEVEAVDLNSWLYLYYTSMAQMGKWVEAPQSEINQWLTLAANTSRAVESYLWSSGDARYLDRERKGAGFRFVESDTPAQIWPLYVGLALRADRILQVLSGITNPNRFWMRATRVAREDGEFELLDVKRWPMPTVAYDDPDFDRDQDGYFRQGQIWPMASYATATALFRYGYEEEAAELRRATLDLLMAADPGGLHDAYDGLTGRVGWAPGSYNIEDFATQGGVGQPSPFQHGVTAAVVLELLLDRHQRERYLMTGDRTVRGYIGSVTDLSTGEAVLSVTADNRNLPLLEWTTTDGQSLKRAHNSILRVSDPYGSVNSTEITIHLPFITPGLDRVSRVSTNGEATLLALDSDPAEWTVKTRDLASIDHYLIQRFQADQEPVDNGGGCWGGQGSVNGLAALFLFSCFLLWRRRKTS